MSVDLPASTWPSTTRCSCGLAPCPPAPSAAAAAAHSSAKSGSSTYSAAGLFCCAPGASRPSPASGGNPGPAPNAGDATTAPPPASAASPALPKGAAGSAAALGRGSLTCNARMPATTFPGKGPI